MNNKLTSHDRSGHEQPDMLAGRQQSAWQPPELSYLGRLGDLVQGGGKTGENLDADPQVTRKQGVG